MKKGYRGFILYAVFVLAVVGIWYFLSETAITSDTYTYHEYQQDMEKGEVYSVIIEQNVETPTGTLVVTLKNDTERHEVAVSDVNAEQEYLKNRGFYNYLVKNIPRASWLSTWLPYLIIFGAMFILFIIHLILNDHWFRHFGKIAQNSFSNIRSALLFLTDILLFFDMIALAITSALISKNVFSFAGLQAGYIHLVHIWA